METLNNVRADNISVAWADSANTVWLSTTRPNALFHSIDQFSDWMFSSIEKTITKS